ncbi:MAG: hypothetical protein OXG60_15050 [Chloroflexi bacterium]|nr:hypothetical protein [Chloroflexota bacterium]
MEEKRKPFVTIFIRKPRVSRLVSAVLILLLIVAMGLFGMQEVERWQEKMRETERQLQERSVSLQEAESRLQHAEMRLDEAERKLLQDSPVWQLREPVGYYLGYSGFVTNLSEATLVFCELSALDVQGEESAVDGHLFFLTVRAHLRSDLIPTDDYQLVGRDKDSARWDAEYLSDEYYMGKRVLEISPFEWSSAKDWEDNFQDWQDHLRTFCDETFNP